MIDLYIKWQELEEKLNNSNMPMILNVFSSRIVDMFIQSSISSDYAIILHINTDEKIEINREITGIKISTYVINAIDDSKPSIIIENLNKSSITIFKAFSATLYENLYNRIDKDSIDEIINKTVDENKNYFSGIRNDLGEMEQQGLYGELLFLKEELIKNNDKALDCWEGINKNKHDFVFADESIEVKTTRNQSRLNIHISNENQLDNSLVKKLKLCVYRLEKVNVGKNIFDLYNEILSLIPSNKYELFKYKLIKAGMDLDNSNYIKFREVKRIVYDVDDAFPKIDKFTCGDRIYSVEYYVSLDGVEYLEEVNYNE